MTKNEEFKTIDMKRARNIVARLGKSQWGWEWNNDNHINTLSDEEVLNDLIILAEVVNGYNKVYVGMISKALKELTWEESMGK